MKNKYKCKHCKRVVTRDGDKQWIKSYCEETGKTVHLTKLDHEESRIKP